MPATVTKKFRPDLSGEKINGHPVSPEDRAKIIARFIEDGKVVGHFSGRLEYGPRALLPVVQ